MYYAKLTHPSNGLDSDKENMKEIDIIETELNRSNYECM